MKLLSKEILLLLLIIILIEINNYKQKQFNDFVIKYIEANNKLNDSTIELISKIKDK